MRTQDQDKKIDLEPPSLEDSDADEDDNEKDFEEDSEDDYAGNYDSHQSFKNMMKDKDEAIKKLKNQDHLRHKLSEGGIYCAQIYNREIMADKMLANLVTLDSNSS